MKLKPYPEYKDSGVEWIGDVPSGWQIQNTDHLAYVTKLAGFEFSKYFKYIPDGEIIALRALNLKEGKIDLNNIKRISADISKALPRSKLHEGDLIVSYVGTIGSIALVPENDKFHLAPNICKLTIVKPDILLNTFLLYYLMSKNGQDGLLYYASQTSQLVISMSKIRKIKIPTPKMNEQIQIIKYLDKKTSEIDLTIEKDTRLIELLKEKRTSLINYVVTKGLDPTVKMKDSGVEWIGEIPEDWELKRLKYNVSVNPPGKKSLSDPKTKVNFLPMEKVSEDGEYDLDSKDSYENVSSGYTYFEDNDVLLAKITPCFENGKGALVENLQYGFGFGTTEFHVFRSNNDVSPKYLYFLTKSHLFRVTGEAFMEGAAGQKRVSTDFVKDFRMPTPPKHEQHKIIKYLVEKTTKIDLTIKKIQENISLLEEYKKSLIHHIVTGKVDVREVEV